MYDPHELQHPLLTFGQIFGLYYGAAAIQPKPRDAADTDEHGARFLRGPNHGEVKQLHWHAWSQPQTATFTEGHRISAPSFVRSGLALVDRSTATPAVRRTSAQIRFPSGLISNPQRLDRTSTRRTLRPPIAVAAGSRSIGGCRLTSSTAVRTPVSVTVIDTRNSELACVIAFVASSVTNNVASSTMPALPQELSASLTNQRTARTARGGGMYNATVRGAQGGCGHAEEPWPNRSADVADRVLHRVVLRLQNVADHRVRTVLTVMHLDLALHKVACLRGAGFA
jgi:hypothetical protein